MIDPGDNACHAENPADRPHGGSHIAKGAGSAGGAKRPIRIQAQMLRDKQACESSGATARLALPDDRATSPNAGEMPRGQWGQADVKRAIAAAEQAGLQCYRVEVAPDGTISIVVGAPAETRASSDSDP